MDLVCFPLLTTSFVSRPVEHLCASLSLLNRSGSRTGEPNGGRDTRQKWPRPRRSTTRRPRRWRRARTTRTTTSTTNHWTQIQTTRKSRDCWKSTRPTTWRWSAPAATARTPCDAHSWRPKCGGPTETRGTVSDPLSTWLYTNMRLTGLRFAQAEQENMCKKKTPNKQKNKTKQACTKTHGRCTGQNVATYGQCVHGDITPVRTGLREDWWRQVQVSWKDKNIATGSCFGDANPFHEYNWSFNSRFKCKQNIIYRRISVGETSCP